MDKDPSTKVCRVVAYVESVQKEVTVLQIDCASKPILVAFCERILDRVAG